MNTFPFEIKLITHDDCHRIAVYVRVGNYRKAKRLPIVFSNKASVRIKKIERFFERLFR